MNYAKYIATAVLAFSGFITIPHASATTVATPGFSPAAGTYSLTQTVTITDATSGAAIYYTTNGATPTTSSTAYSSAITVSATETLEAIAAKAGDTNSAVASAVYTISSSASWPFVDSFNRAACTSNCGNGGGLGSNYTQFYTPSSATTAPVTIISDAVSMPVWSGSPNSMAGAVVSEAGYTFTANQYAQAVITSGGTGSANPVFLIVHYIDANNFNYISFQGGPSLNTVTGGVSTWVGAYSGGITVGHTYRVEVIGNNYTVYDNGSGYNGTSDGTLTTSVNSGAGPTGIAIDGYSATPGSFNNFQTNNCTSTCPTDSGSQAATPAFSPAGGTYASAQTVTISDTTSGATIYYTTNGTTPTTASSIYTAAITVSINETLQAIAAASGYTTSSVGSAAYIINGPAATPGFSPAAGAYGPAQSVTISDATSGSTIYYTTNGTTPTTSSSTYSSAINVSSTETLEAVAIAPLYTTSAVGSAAYTINGAVSTPGFSPVAGTYSSTQTVTITDATSGAAIYYTTNGATPTTSSTAYSSAITVSATETLGAIATKAAYLNSAVASAAYTISSSASWPFLDSFDRAACTSNCGNGGGLGPNYTQFYSPTSVSNNPVTILSDAVSMPVWSGAYGAIMSGAVVSEAGYTFTANQYAQATVTAGGTGSGNPVFLIVHYIDANDFNYIYLGGGPSLNTVTGGVSTWVGAFSGGVTVGHTYRVEVIGNNYTVYDNGSGYNGTSDGTLTTSVNSGAGPTGIGIDGYSATPGSFNDFQSNNCTTTCPADSGGSQVATPTFSPAAGTYTSTQTVTITDSTSGATIYYTTNGATPTTASSTYSSAITVSATETLEAIAAAGGYSNSSVASAAYTINGAVATPGFSPAAGTYTSTQTVTITDSTSGATIYYTTNGTTPTTASSTYTAAITVSATETLEAIAARSGYSNSSVASAVYTISAPQVATPAFSPVAGNYTSTQTVTISDTTSGANIYYTTNGTTPTTASTHYSAAVSVSATETLEAIATESGYTNSAVASAVYTIGTSSAPTNGYYTIQNLGSGLVLNGGGAGTTRGTWATQATYNSGVNNSQVWGVSSLGNGTYQIIGIGSSLSLDDYADGTGNGNEIDVYTNSAASGNTGQIWYLTPTSGGYYTLKTQDIVNASVNACIEPSGGSTASGAEIVVYTCTNTSAEQWEFVPYTGTVGPANGTYQIVSKSSGLVLDGGGSGTAVGTWVIQDTNVNGANQAWGVSGLGNYSGTYEIINQGDGGLSLDDDGDGTANGNEIDVYTNSATSGNTGQAWILSPVGGGYYTLASSDIVNAEVNSCIEPTGGSTASGTDIVVYTCTNTSAEEWEFVPVSGLNAGPFTPVLSPVAGTYNVQATVTISDQTPNSTIYYTTNGTTPTTNSPVYSGAFNVTASATVEAIAATPGFTQLSAVASNAYTITHIVNQPTFSPAEGEYNGSVTVTISDSISGATIYYTTNGTTPTTSSADVYSGPIDLTSSATVEAMAVASGYTPSSTVTALYTIGNGSAGNCTGLSVGSSVAGTADMNGFVPFPATNLWNVNIANAPVDPNNAALQTTGGFAGESTHVNFGASPGDGGIPFMIVDSSSTPKVPINVIGYARESDNVVAPYPNNVPIEGAAADCSGWPDTYQSDSHTNVLDRHTCWDYETYNTNRCNGLYDADGEVIWDMANGELRPWGWTSTDAAGLSVMAGLLKYDEAASGTIKHAIRYTMQQSKNDANGGYFVEPASHAAGTYYGTPVVEGMRIRLNSTFNITGYSAINQAILTAFQQYGLIMADNGGYLFIQGATDSRWDDNDLGNLAGIPSSDFTIVQMYPAYPGWDSVTAPTGPSPVINSFTSTATSVSSGSPVTFNFSVTGDSYDYIDMIGPVRLTSGSGSVTINPTATQTYTLYSVNQYGNNGDGAGYGVTVSTPITVTVPGSTVVPPTFTPVAGTYTGAQVVTLNTTTYPYATIYYTTNGTTPTTNSTMYPQVPQPMSAQSQGHLESITVSVSSTIKAIAVAPGYSSPSAVSSASYTIN